MVEVEYVGIGVVLVVVVVVSEVRCPAVCPWGAGDQCGGRGTSLSTTVAAKTLTLVVVPRWDAPWPPKQN